MSKGPALIDSRTSIDAAQNQAQPGDKIDGLPPLQERDSMTLNPGSTTFSNLHLTKALSEAIFQSCHQIATLSMRDPPLSDIKAFHHHSVDCFITEHSTPTAASCQQLSQHKINPKTQQEFMGIFTLDGYFGHPAG